MTMHKTTPPPRGAHRSAPSFAAPAQANFKVGIADQHAAMFDNAQLPGAERSSASATWCRGTGTSIRGQKAEVDGLHEPRRAAAGADVLVHFTARRGCYNNGRYSKRKVCRPRASRRTSTRSSASGATTRSSRPFGVWNEGNHVSQPTSTQPEARGAVLPRRPQPLPLVQARRRRRARHDEHDQLGRRSSSASPRARRGSGACTTTATSTASAASGTRDLLRIALGRGLADRDRRDPEVRQRRTRARRRARRARRSTCSDGLASTTRASAGMKGRITRLYNYQWTGAPRAPASTPAS